MDGVAIASKLFLAFIIGAVIGLEREINEKKSVDKSAHISAILGIRSFSLIAVLGGVVGILYLQFVFLALIISAGFFVLLIVFYVLDSRLTKDIGLTTELAGLWCFVLGVLIGLGIFPMQLIFAMTILIALLLSQKERIKNVVEDIEKRELNAFIGFAIIAVVILPFLPNTAYRLSDIPGFLAFITNVGLHIGNIAQIEIINPFKLWLIVALVTGVDLIGYILEKLIGGKKGWLITSTVGGFVSSTATTQSLAQESRSTHQTYHLVAAAVVSNVVSFVQIAFLIGTLNVVFLLHILPVLVSMICVGGLIAFFLLTKKETVTEGNKKEVVHKSIFDLTAAIKFAFLFLSISIISKLALSLFGDAAFLLTTGIGAFIGLDAVMINTSELVKGNIEISLGVAAFLLANGVNLGAKSVYSYLQGSKEFARLFFMSMIGIVLSGFIGYCITLVLL